MGETTSQTQPSLDQPNPENRPLALAQSLDLTFNNLDLLRLALTHRSVAHEWRSAAPNVELSPADRSNKRMEFLGDAVLGYVVAADLYDRFLHATEGDLTSRRVALVRAERLVTWARSINLGEYLYLAQGERISESNRDRILSGAFEAIIGAIALDQGIAAAAAFVKPFLDQDVDESLAEGIAANPKGQLQEYLQEHYRQPPTYRIIDETGPDHARIFTSEVLVGDTSLGVGVGESKRLAEQAAAAKALDELGHRNQRQPSANVRKRRRAQSTKGESRSDG